MTQANGFVPLFQPNQADIIVMQGSRYRMVVSVVCDWENDLNSWTGRMEVRDSRSPDSILLADLSAYVSTLGTPANQAVLDIDADAPGLLAVDWSSGVYDVELLADDGNPARTLRVLQGSFTLDTEVTR